MSAKPQKLCYLKTGKALGAFPDFVATWNWLVSFCHNLKGEGDAYDATGDESDKNGIRVDKSVDDHPVIRGGGGDFAITLVGNDEDVSTVLIGDANSKNKYTVKLASASDSNVVAIPSIDNDGIVTVSIGVYYK